MALQLKQTAIDYISKAIQPRKESLRLNLKVKSYPNFSIKIIYKFKNNNKKIYILHEHMSLIVLMCAIIHKYLFTNNIYILIII